MSGQEVIVGTKVQLAPEAVGGLIDALRLRGYRVIGPRIVDDAVIYDDLDGAEDLPIGWGDRQDGGTYRLVRRDDGAMFGYGSGMQGWKRFLFPPRHRLFSAQRTENGFAVDPVDVSDAPLAFLGVRACEIAAMARQARVFGDPAYADPGYQSRWSSAFVVAVECHQGGDTCFCASLGTGPEVTGGYDLKLVEWPGEGFVAEAGSQRGAEILAGLPDQGSPSRQRLEAGRGRLLDLAARQRRRLEPETARALKTIPDHPQWDDVATRCMGCGNCTMVCPTCFCSTVEDVTDLKGDRTERWRRWDSCFTLEFSYVHGGAARVSGKARYRQWITHKLSTWHDQFGESGCVGCGRCITWCPVGIDITAEVHAIGGAVREASNGSG